MSQYGGDCPAAVVEGSPFSGCDSHNTKSAGFEVKIIMEHCDCGSLRQMLDKAGAPFRDPGTGQVVYKAVLATAADVAKGMAQLHAMHIVHSDCKTQNILLKSGGGDERGFIAKVSIFCQRLSCQHCQTFTLSYLADI